MQTVAFLGLGRMGAPMAANLARAGFRVQAWNRTPSAAGVAVAREAGAHIANSIAEAVRGANAVLVCVGDVPDVEEVLLGAGGVAEHAAPGALVIDFSTIGADAARRFGAALGARGLRFLDAPVSGGDIGARAGTLTVMVGGDAGDFDEAQPILDAVGGSIHHCGTCGAGQAVKLANQVLGALNMVAVTEALRLAESMNIDPSLVVRVCQSGAAGSWALANLGPRILARDFAPGFSVAHILKDLRLVEEAVGGSATTASEGAAHAATGGNAATQARRNTTALPGVALAQACFEAVAALDGGAGAQLGTQAMIRGYEDKATRPRT